MKKLDSVSARIFVSVVEEGGIGRAAARENLVTSAVSKRISDLEAMFGVALLERSAQGIVPTAAGIALARHARLILAAVDRAHDELSEFVKGIRGRVRVRASASALAAGLTHDVGAYLQAHPAVQLDLEELKTTSIFSEVLEGRADIGIGPDIFRPPELEHLPYARYELCAVVPRDHPLARMGKVDYSDLLAYDQVEQPQGSALRQLLDQMASQAGLEKRTRIRVNGFETACGMVGSGMGVSVVPSFLKASQSTTHGVLFLPLLDEWSRTEIVIVFRTEPPLSIAASELVAHLRHATARG